MNVALLVLVIPIVIVIVRMRRIAEAYCRSCPGFCSFHFAISRRRVCYQGGEQLLRNASHVLDGAMERLFVRLRRFGEAAQFADKLQRRSADLVVRGGRQEVMQGLNISAHRFSLLSEPVKMGQERDSISLSLAKRLFPLLLRQPLVEVGPVVNIKNVVIASRKHGQLWMAASDFNGVGQLLNFL